MAREVLSLASAATAQRQAAQGHSVPTAEVVSHCLRSGCIASTPASSMPWILSKLLCTGATSVRTLNSASASARGRARGVKRSGVSAATPAAHSIAATNSSKRGRARPCHVTIRFEVVRQPRGTRRREVVSTLSTPHLKAYFVSSRLRSYYSLSNVTHRHRGPPQLHSKAIFSKTLWAAQLNTIRRGDLAGSLAP